MWELRSKNQYGEVAQVQKENSFTKKPVYDNICTGGASYNKANLNIRYTVEWLPERNFEAFEKSQRVEYGVNPWELNNEYLTDSLGLAIRMMCLREVDDKSGKPRLYMYIMDPNGNDAEACATIPDDTVSILRNMVQDGINRKLENNQKAVDEMTKRINLFQSFIKKYHAEKLWEEYETEMMRKEMMK